MQIKHTFLFTFILGLAWAGYLFGYITGPDPASNGIFGDVLACSTAGCHVGNPVNAAGGTLTLSGLPATWVPGQAYPLTVTVQRTGAVLYGFQLSAVVDAINQQAGTFTPGNARVKVITGSGIQFAEHSNASVQPGGTFTVTWTAPATAVGKVRFNLAGNAANGNIQNTGDFIYTRVFSVDPAAVQPPPDNSVRAYTLTDRGGVSLLTDGAGALPDVGYSRIQPDDGNTTPAGVAIFGGRTNGVLVSETGVPATPALATGRIYAEVAGEVRTGLAIANPNDTPANITFFFTDASGADLGSGSTQIPAKGQLARFLNEAPYKTFSGTTFQGTFSFTSTVPVGVVALRGYTNQKGDFLMSTLPVIDTSVPGGAGTVVLPHFADGGGWVTQILLVNPSDTAMTGSIQFTNDNGQPVTVGSTTTYSVPRRSSQKIATPGTAGATTGGAVRIVPTGGGAVPTALVVFSYKPLGVVVAEAGVPTLSGTAFRTYVESSGADGQAGNIQSGIAVANNGAAAASVTFELTNLDGSTTGLPAPVPVSVPASGHAAKFLAQIFPAVPNPFRGVLRISTTAAGVSVVGLRARYNERASAEAFIITTTPVSLEGAPPSSAESMFPQLVNGGGYTTQFILFSGSAGQSSSGNLRFVKTDGSAFNLTLN
jgi:Reeler domain